MTWFASENARSRRVSGRWLTALLVLAVVGTGCEVPTGLPILESRFRFEVESVVVPVAGVPGSASARQTLSQIDMASDVRGATIWVTPVNPSAATGTLAIQIRGGNVTVNGTVNVAGGPNQAIPLTQAQVQALLGGEITITASGTLCRAAGCGLAPPPFPTVTLENELELLVALGGEG
jgi:hypothetical protein